MPTFDFEHWSQLAQQNSAEFEQQRRAALMELVEQAPTERQASLRALVETLCAPTKNTTPLQRAVEAHNRMMTNLHELHAQFGRLQEAVEGTKAKPLLQPALVQFTTLVAHKT